MNAQVEVRKANVGVKKANGVEYPVTIVEVEINGYNEQIGNHVGKDRFVNLGDCQFDALVKKSVVQVKKTEAGSYPITIVTLELDDYNKFVGGLVGHVRTMDIN